MTKVYLLNVPFENNYKDTVYFASETEQLNYMLGRPRTDFEEFSYQRKDNIIRIPAHIDTLYNYNYVAYQNSNISNKWMYAFITDMEYVNEGRTDVKIETDVIQTWMFNYDVKASFVEREHVKDDTIGLNTVPENLETGEYICDHVEWNGQLRYKGIIVGATIDIARADVDFDAEDDTFPPVDGLYYNGIYSGIKYFYFSNPDLLNKILIAVANKGQSDGIVAIFMCPSAFVPTTATWWDPTVDDLSKFYNPHIPRVDTSMGSKEVPWEYFSEDYNDVLPKKPTSLNGYTPNNNKLLTYPYCYLFASNNSGGSAIYHYELFDDLDFTLFSSITPGMSIRLVPRNYKGMSYNNAEGLNLGKFPICAWTTDVYTNWLTQNSVNIGVDVAGGIAQMGLGALAMSNPVSAAAYGGFGLASMISGAMGIGSTIGSVIQHSMIPPAMNGNINSGDVTYSTGWLTFHLYQMNIKKEYAQIIDEYFDMFGYKVCRVKKPETNHRKHFWYTKTLDVNIDGAIPNNDLEKIKQCYNAGITFWRSTSEMGNYKVKNTIV